VPRPIISMRSETDVDNAIEEEKARTLVLPFSVETQGASGTAGAGSRPASSKDNRATKFLSTCSDIKSVQSLYVCAALLRFPHDVNRLGGHVNHRSARDADFGNKVVAADLLIRNGGGAWSRSMGGIQQRDLPQRLGIRAKVAIRIKGIDAVMLRGDERDVVRRTGLGRPRSHGDARQVQGLGINIPVHELCEELAKRAGVHIRRHENGFVGIGPGPGDIVVLGDYIVLGPSQLSANESTEEKETTSDCERTPPTIYSSKRSFAHTDSS